MTLQDGTKKMSKSAESDASRINLLDPPDVLYGKIKRAKTDGELSAHPVHGICILLHRPLRGTAGDVCLPCLHSDLLQPCNPVSWAVFRELLACRCPSYHY